MSVKILVCDPMNDKGIDILKANGFEINVMQELEHEKLIRIVCGYDIIIVRSRTMVTQKVIECGERLKVIGRVGSGLDNIDLKAAEQNNVFVLSTPEASSDSVAELTIGLMLALVRKIIVADNSMKAGKWLKKMFVGSVLKGKTLGLIGLGRVGLKVARIANEIGMKILITKRKPPNPKVLKSLDAEFLSLQELLKRSDVVSVHIPLTNQTSGMISYNEFRLMKEGAVLLNTARGRIVDEDALLDALKSGKLGGAALDVYEVEPSINLELIRLPNTVCTPHIGGQSKESQEAASILLAEKIVGFFKK